MASVPPIVNAAPEEESLLVRIARAVMERERQKLGIPAQEQKAELVDADVDLKRAQAAYYLQGGRQHATRPPSVDSPDYIIRKKRGDNPTPEQILEDLAEIAKAKQPPQRAPINTTEAGSFEEYVQASPERRAEIEKARKSYMQADDRPLSIRPSIQIIQTPDGLARVDKRTGQVMPLESESGQVQPGPTADMRNKVAARSLVQTSINAVDDLSQKIITKVGPAQRATALARGAEAVLGNDPEFRVYQDARMALAGNLAVAQQGSRPSDADIKAIWLPLVPDAFRDTKESAAQKWALIRQMSLPAGQDAPGAPPRRIRFDNQGNVVQ